MHQLLKVVSRPKFIDYLAPDNSEIRLLAEGTKGGLCECTLGPMAVTKPVSHKKVEEVWYVVAGRGTIRREFEGDLFVNEIKSGDSIVVPVGTKFQFMADAKEQLVMLLSTMPPWYQEIDEGGPLEFDAEEGGTWDRVSPPPIEWQIQGNWWQYGKRSDETVQLAHIRLARTGQLKYMLSGKSWTANWVERAGFRSIEAKFFTRRAYYALSMDRTHWL